MSAVRELERELAMKIITFVRAGIYEAAIHGGYPEGRQGEKQIELEYALLAVVEHAVNCGLNPVGAFRAIRDTGIQLWAVRRVEQHGGPPCTNCIEQDIQSMGSLYLTTAGTEGGVAAVKQVEAPDPEIPATRH